MLLPLARQKTNRINPAKIKRYATDKSGSTVPS
jgi:hypothetical protein